MIALTDVFAKLVSVFSRNALAQGFATDWIITPSQSETHETVWKMKRLRKVVALLLLLGTLCTARADSITESSSGSEDADTSSSPGLQILDNRTDTGFNQTQANEDQATTGNMTSPDYPDNGVLTSPNYPENYPDNLNLTQTIQVTQGKKIKIQFTNFTLIRFSKDYVRITDMDGTVLAHLGHFGEHKSKNWHKEIISSSSTVFVVFITSRWDNAQGWRLEWGECNSQ